MDEDEINCVLMKNPIVNKHYTGEIYSTDTLPMKLEKGKFYISNIFPSTHDYDNEVGHWICNLYYADTGILYYMDSFGTFPNLAFWMTLLETRSKELQYNDIQLQNNETSTCAIHVILWCTLFSFGLNPEQILEYAYDIKGGNSVSHFDYDLLAQKWLKEFYGEKRGIFYEF